MKGLNSLISKAIRRIRWYVDSCNWEFRSVLRKRPDYVPEITLTIGITTFLNRYDRCFKPLLTKMAFLFPDCQIIVAANGNVLKEKQQIYLSEMRKFCSSFINVELIEYSDPMGLSHLWNQIIIRSANRQVLMLNDDLQIRMDFRTFIVKGGILNEKIATINSSWSHFLISSDILNLVGQFDEGLKEIGGEDDDYMARLATLSIDTGNYNTDSIAAKDKKRNHVDEINSYGKDMSKEEGGYSTLNVNYLNGKWKISDEYFDGAVEIRRRKNRFWMLRQKS